jgi:proteasome-associated ATPase
MLAKAVANSLAKQALGKDATAWFLNISGPELLNKYVGETERKIRELFAEAREKASEGMPVIVFFDEMESMFRTRGSGVSSDMESTVVPTILSQIDGVEELSNVIVIGASNREDLIDPALLRPGRLDIKIRIDRPDQDAAHDIMGLYLTSDLPLADNLKVMLDDTIALMFRKEKEDEFLEVTYVNGSSQIMYFCDFLSGAMIRSIVDRAKRTAIKRYVTVSKDGRLTPMITGADLTQAVADEYKENEDLPNTTSPDDWAKISGKKGERIASVRALRTPDEPGRIENVNVGQFL